MTIIIREVVADDLPILFEFQREPAGVEMAVFPSRDWDAFQKHWRERVLGVPENLVRTIVADGEVAGWVNGFTMDGKRLIGYWLGQRFWGHGIATEAVLQLLEVEPIRPLFAHVAKTNIGSIRVLNKCGFEAVGEETGDDGVVELIMRREA